MEDMENFESCHDMTQRVLYGAQLDQVSVETEDVELQDLTFTVDDVPTSCDILPAPKSKNIFTCCVWCQK